MSPSLWGESEAGSWTPLLQAGPGCHPSSLYTLYNKPNSEDGGRSIGDTGFVCLFCVLNRDRYTNVLFLGPPSDPA